MPDNKVESSVHVTSHNQSGGITAHTVNIGRQRFMLNDEVKQEILKLLDRRVGVMMYHAGPDRSQTIAEELGKYLSEQGFVVTGMVSGMPIPIDEPVTIFHRGYEGNGMTIGGGQQLIAIDGSL